MKKILVTILVLCSFSVPTQSATFNELVQIIRTDLKDEGPSYRWETSQMVDRINVIQSLIVSHTKALRARTSTTPVAGRIEYDLPSNIMGAPIGVYYGVYGTTESYRRLSKTTMGGLHVSNANWETRTGTPDEYYIRGNKIGIVPAPNSSIVSTDTLRFDYVVQPTALTTSTLNTVPFNGSEKLYSYHYLIAEGVKATYVGGWEQFWALVGYMKNNLDNMSDSFIGETIFE
jgi:hypothetical protein